MILSDAFIHRGSNVRNTLGRTYTQWVKSKTGRFSSCFNGFLKVDFQGSRVTSDGGLILIRELDEHLGMSQLIEQHLTDSRRGKNTQLPLADLLRQSVYSRLAGYEDVNDAERLSPDPTFRLIGSEKIWDRGAALTSRLQSFETEMLAEAENLAGLATINRELIGEGRSHRFTPAGRCSTSTAPRSRSMASRSTAPTTDISNPPAITLCCCSIVKATAWQPNSGPATCTAPTTGKSYWCPRSSGSRSTGKKWWCGPTRPLPNPRSTRRSNSGA